MIFRLLTALFSVALLLSCNNKEGHDIGTTEEVSIAHLKSLCQGDHRLIAENISVRGVVVATDWLGELHNSAILIDKTGGLVVAIDLDNVSEELPLNSEITIQCNGLMLARIGGNIKLGVAPTGDFPLDNISSESFSRYIHIVELDKAISPTTKRIEEIGVEDICTLVKFDNLRICDAERGLSWCDIVDDEAVTTYRTFVDREDNTLAIRTLSTCNYAMSVIPANEMSVAGVIDYSDNRPFLTIVNKAITGL